MKTHKIHFEIIYKDGSLKHLFLTEQEAKDKSNDNFVKRIFHHENPHHPINREIIPKFY